MSLVALGRAPWPALVPSLAILAASALLPSVAGAAPCGRPDVDVTFPPNEATGVPTNAILSAHYRAPAELDDETATLTGPDGAPVDGDLSYDVAESMLRVVPRAPLAPGEHRIVWPGLRGVATSRGLGQTTTFTVITGADGAAPRFDGLTKLEWDLSREQDPCTSGLEDRFTYELELGNVSDDERAALLSVVVFETESPTHEASSAPKELAVLPLGEGDHVQVARASTKAGKVCFAAVVRDLTLNVSGGGDQQVCAQTTAPPFFAGCAVGRTRGQPVGSFALLALSLLALCLRGRSARQRRESSGFRTEATRASPRAALCVGALTLGMTLGCDRSRSPHGAPPRPRLPEASPFVPLGDGWSQRHVRLPDDGEWRCAELDGVVLCSGGEPPAGVVPASAARGYRCGERRGSARHERVCVDASPDYPPGDPARFRCRFSAVHGLTRECQPRQSGTVPARAALPAGAPNCWLDADCGGRCERGFCAAGPP